VKLPNDFKAEKMIDIKAQGKGILWNSNNQTCFAVTTPQKTKMSSTHILLLNVFFFQFFLGG